MAKTVQFVIDVTYDGRHLPTGEEKLTPEDIADDVVSRLNGETTRSRLISVYVHEVDRGATIWLAPLED